MKSIMDQSRLLPYDRCFDDRLRGFLDKEYVNDLCFDIYGENKVDKCKVQKDFCEYCCHYHVGKKYYYQRSECEKRCKKIVSYKLSSDEKIKRLNKVNKNKKRITPKGKKRNKGKININKTF
jgi:hypothetical protein